MSARLTNLHTSQQVRIGQWMFRLFQLGIITSVGYQLAEDAFPYFLRYYVSVQALLFITFVSGCTSLILISDSHYFRYSSHRLFYRVIVILLFATALLKFRHIGLGSSLFIASFLIIWVLLLYRTFVAPNDSSSQ